jgi:hypothetical protein
VSALAESAAAESAGVVEVESVAVESVAVRESAAASLVVVADAESRVEALSDCVAVAESVAGAVSLLLPEQALKSTIKLAYPKAIFRMTTPFWLPSNDGGPRTATTNR